MINYVTPSLINSWLNLLNNEYATIEDFLQTLNKEPYATNEYMQKGIDFEADVYAGKYPKFDKYINGCLKQVRIFGTCNGIGISGIIDVLQPNWIYDIKWTKSYQTGKYGKGSQHIFYPYVTGINNFAYIVNPDCYFEEYRYKQGQAEKLIEDFLKWLEIAGYYNIWQEKWRKETNGN